MIRKSPLNYLITVAFGAILWVVTAVFYGGSFSESLMLSVSTPEEFLSHFRTMMAIAAGIGIITCLYWYFYGSLEKTAGNLGKARKIWWGSFVFLIILSVGILLGLVFMNLKEGILTTDWLITYALFSLHTWFFFWLCSFTMSPRAVINIPLFK
jgi:hypothetical protein